MEIFNIGIGELLVILVIMYVLLGPEGMLKAARWMGQAMRDVYRFFNETWRSITDVPMDIRDLPRALLDETGLKDTYDEIRKETRAVRHDLNQTVGQLNEGINPAQKTANTAAAEAKTAEAEASNTIRPPVPAVAQHAQDQKADASPGQPDPGKYDLKITPARRPGDVETQPGNGSQPGSTPPAGLEAEIPPKPKRGRPRKGEVRPPPPPKIPRKRGRPPKNRPEATAAEAGAAAAGAAEAEAAETPTPGVRERPDIKPGRLPRTSPAQPGDPEAPMDVKSTVGARAYAHKPAPAEPSSSNPASDEETHDHHAA